MSPGDGFEDFDLGADFDAPPEQRTGPITLPEPPRDVLDAVLEAYRPVLTAALDDPALLDNVDLGLSEEQEARGVRELLKMILLIYESRRSRIDIENLIRLLDTHYSKAFRLLEMGHIEQDDPPPVTRLDDILRQAAFREALVTDGFVEPTILLKPPQPFSVFENGIRKLGGRVKVSPGFGALLAQEEPGQWSAMVVEGAPLVPRDPYRSPARGVPDSRHLIKRMTAFKARRPGSELMDASSHALLQMASIAYGKGPIDPGMITVLGKEGDGVRRLLATAFRHGEIAYGFMSPAHSDASPYARFRRVRKFPL